MTVREHLGRNLALGGALAVLGMGAVTMTDHALGVAPPPVNAPDTALGGSNPTSVPIPDNTPGGVISTINMGAGIVRDVDVVTNIPHNASGDLNITLTSPTGKVVTLVGASAGALGPASGTDNSYNGTLWDDQAGALASEDATYVSGGLEASLVPEGALGGFVGLQAQGTWTLRVSDNDPDVLLPGAINGWSLGITAVPAVPALTDSAPGDTPAVAIPEGATGVARTIQVSGAKSYLWDANLLTEITHSNPGDLDLLLSHAGRTVPISTRNNGDFFFYSGTAFDDAADVPVSRAEVLAPAGKLLTPEGAMAAFAGTDPNGAWTLQIVDRDATPAGGVPGGDTGTGTLQSWSLALKSTDAGAAGGPGASPGAPVAGASGGVVLPGPSKRVGLRAFALSKAKGGKVKVKLGWLRGAGKVSWNVRLSTKIGKKTFVKSVKGSGGVGPKTITRTIKVPVKWQNRKINVKLTIRNGGVNIARTKSITL